MLLANSNAGPPIGQTYNNMDMSRSVRVTVKKLQELTTWTVMWYRVWNRAQAVQSVIPGFICGELPAQIEFCLVWVLLLVKTIRAALPDIDCDTLEWLVGGSITNDTVHVRDFAIFWHSLDNT
jgi:hypothetical protein